MASLLSSSYRSTQRSLCRQCANATLKRPAVSAPFQSAQLSTRSKSSTEFSRPRVLTASNGVTTRFPSILLTNRRSYKTVEEAKSRYKSGPFSWKAGIFFLVAGVGLTIYFRYEKARLARARVAEANKGIGKPLVGGPFHLTDHNGEEFTEQNLKGRYSLVYFGFTHCPDICPEELDKMAGMIDQVKEKHGKGVLRSVFISCDPARDTPEVIRRYLAEFHDDILGMSGSWQEVKDVCKVYRVYFSTPPDVEPGQDYLVDHSIYFYLMDPEGDFVEAIGRNFTVDAAAKVINDHIADWKSQIDRS